MNDSIPPSMTPEAIAERKAAYEYAQGLSQRLYDVLDAANAPRLACSMLIEMLEKRIACFGIMHVEAPDLLDYLQEEIDDMDASEVNEKLLDFRCHDHRDIDDLSWLTAVRYLMSDEGQRDDAWWSEPAYDAHHIEWSRGATEFLDEARQYMLAFAVRKVLSEKAGTGFVAQSNGG